MKALIVPNEANSWKYAARFVNIALRAGFRVDWALESSKVRQDEYSSFSEGSYILPLDSSHEARRRFLQSIAEALKVRTKVVAEIPRCRRTVLAPTQVCFFADAGSPFSFASVLSEAGFDFDPITSREIKEGRLQAFDALIFPGGGDYGPPRQSELLGEIGRRKVREFLRNGGGVWGSCAGCCNLILYSDEKKPPWRANYSDWKQTESLEVINSEYWGSGMSGVGKLVVSNLENHHPLMFGMPEEFDLVWHLGPFLTTASIQRWIDGASAPTHLIEVKGFTNHWSAAEHLNAPPREAKQLETTYAARGIRFHKYGLSAGYYGRGKVVACAGHPEFGLDFLLEKIGTPARILSNFLFWVAPTQSRKSMAFSRKKAKRYDDHRPFFVSIGKCLNTIHKQVSALALESKTLTEPLWLQEKFAASTFGLSARRKWPKILQRLNDLPSEIRSEATELMAVADELSLETQSTKGGTSSKRAYGDENATSGGIFQSSKLSEEQLCKIVGSLLYSPSHEQDYGWQGVLSLLSSASTKIVESARNYGVDPASTAKKSPYDLIWDYYLGALYDLINAKKLLRARKTLAADSLLLTRCYAPLKNYTYQSLPDLPQYS